MFDLRVSGFVYEYLVWEMNVFRFVCLFFFLPCTASLYQDTGLSEPMEIDNNSSANFDEVGYKHGT